MNVGGVRIKSIIKEKSNSITFFEKRLTIIQSMCIIINKSRRYLSWIEGLTTNQNVIGSNPIRRTN